MAIRRVYHKIKSFFLGLVPIKKIYLGNTLVWPEPDPVAPPKEPEPVAPILDPPPALSPPSPLPVIPAPPTPNPIPTLPPEDNVPPIPGAPTPVPPVPSPTFDLALKVAGTGLGSIGANPYGTTVGPSIVRYTKDTNVTLTAIPSDDTLFVNWSGNLSGTTNPSVITMDDYKEVTGHFKLKPKPGKLKITSSNTGSFTLTPPGTNVAERTYSYPAFTDVTLTVTQTSDYWIYVGWSITNPTSSGATNPVVITIGDDITREFTMHFQEVRYLTVATSGSGNITLNPLGTSTAFGVYRHPKNTYVQCTANASQGYVFSHWTGALTGSENPKQVLLDQDRNITAVFTAIPPPPSNYTLTVNTTGTGTGTITLNPPGGIYAPGTVVTATVTLTGGSSFLGWNVEGVTYYTLAVQITMNSNKTATASLQAPASGGNDLVFWQPSLLDIRHGPKNARLYLQYFVDAPQGSYVTLEAYSDWGITVTPTTGVLEDAIGHYRVFRFNNPDHNSNGITDTFQILGAATPENYTVPFDRYIDVIGTY